MITWSVVISADDVSSGHDVISGPADRAQARPKNSGPDPRNSHHGQIGHVTQIRLSDWSIQKILRSDWSAA